MQADMLDVILSLLRKTQATDDLRDDETLYRYFKNTEAMTITETSTTVTTRAHPVKWDEFTWNLATWS